MGKNFFKTACTGIFLITALIYFPPKAVLSKEKLAVNSNEAYLNNPHLSSAEINSGIKHKKFRRILNGKPAEINIITLTPGQSSALIKPTYGEHFLNSVKRVSDFASGENAIAAVNASFFKPDIGAPLGVSIIDGELLTGPIYRRVVFGVTADRQFIMDKIDITGEVRVGENLRFKLHNFNQPLFSRTAYTVFTDRWGEKTPPTAPDFCHVVVRNNIIELVKQSSIEIPPDGYVVVGPRALLKGRINKGDRVDYTVKIIPENWKSVKYAVSGGPYLIKDGNFHVDRQRFTDKFLFRKEPRTAVGYSKDGRLFLVTVDGRKEGVSEGATIPELAGIMYELGAYNAMNLDGGSSTQMVYKGKIVNTPTVKGGGKVTNALLIIMDRE